MVVEGDVLAAAMVCVILLIATLDRWLNDRCVDVCTILAITDGAW